jgi:hypothetical protein
MNIDQSTSRLLEISRLHVIDKLSKCLTSEILLAQHGDGMIDQYRRDYLITKKQYQEAANGFNIFLHEMWQ